MSRTNLYFGNCKKKKHASKTLPGLASKAPRKDLSSKDRTRSNARAGQVKRRRRWRPGSE